MSINTRGMRIKTLLGALTLATTSTLIAIAATAQEQPTAVFRPREVIPDAADKAFYGSNDTFPNQNFRRSAESLVGIGGFPENSIGRDGEKIHRIYRDLLSQQVSSDPLIRTADLPNPYNTSVLTQPNSSTRMMGSEFIIEQPPQAQFPPQPPQPSMTPSGLPQRY